MKRIKHKIARSTAALFLIASASLADAQIDDRSTTKGVTSWRIAGNVGLSHGGTFRREFGSFAVGAERGMTDLVGPSFLRGRLSAAVELVPVFVLAQETTTYAVGFNLLGRHYLETERAIRPFITLGIGMLVSKDAIPSGTANLNFTPQLGAGVAFADGAGRVFTLEYRLHHLSNGGRVDPNPGINSSFVQFGLTFSRSRR